MIFLTQVLATRNAVELKRLLESAVALAVKEGQLQSAAQENEDRKRKLEEREEEVQNAAQVNEEKKLKLEEEEKQLVVRERVMIDNLEEKEKQLVVRGQIMEDELYKERKARVLCEKQNAELMEEIESEKAEKEEIKAVNKKMKAANEEMKAANEHMKNLLLERGISLDDLLFS